MIKELMWRQLAKLLAKPVIANWLIKQAQKTPYSHLINTKEGPVTTQPNYIITDQTDLYMGGWWLFNPYDRETRKTKYKWFPWSIRIHHIAREDYNEHEHDHPWDQARTIILKTGYWEKRKGNIYWRRKGDTVLLNHNLFHKINCVPSEGAWTLFITKNFIDDWGFLVNGVKIPHREYFALRDKEKL